MPPACKVDIINVTVVFDLRLSTHRLFAARPTQGPWATHHMALPALAVVAVAACALPALPLFPRPPSLAGTARLRGPAALCVCALAASGVDHR